MNHPIIEPKILSNKNAKTNKTNKTITNKEKFAN